jgi:predicted GH43/DUF377 family glycosyl hydrolase
MSMTTRWLWCGAISSLLACGGGHSGNPDGGGNSDGGNGNGTVATISVSPATAAITVGKTLQFTAVAKDSSGNTVNAALTWSSDDATIATVSSSGLATGVQPGTSTTIRASANAGAVSGAATLNVAWKPLVIPTKSLPNGTSGSAYSQAVQVSGNGGYQWNGATIAPNTTNGLNIGIDSGVLYGTPGATGLQPIFYTVNDNSGSLGIQYELSIGGTSGNNTYTNSPGPGTAGTAYDYVPTTNYLQVGCDVGGNLVFGSLPPGLSMNSLSQEVTGTPTLGGHFPVTVYGQWGSCVPPAQDGLPTDLTTFVFSIAAGPSAPPGSYWTRAASAAAVTPGAAGWDGLMTGQPSLVKAGSNYFLYYDGQDATDYHYSIGVATSTDGVTFTKSSGNPVLKPNPQPGAWDMRDVRNPVVLYDGTTYRMWYWGSDGVSTQIGLATSTDGLSWTNAATPVSWNTSVSFGPETIIKVGSTYTLYYPNGQLNRATSTDGQNWTDQGPVTIVGSGTFLSMEKPAVVYDGSTYRLWYSASEQLGGGLGNGGASVMVQRIAYGTSPDGINWTPVGTVFTPGAAGAWDRPAVGEPSVIKDGSVYRLAYVGGRGNFPGGGSGWFFTEGSLGIATAP